MKAQTQRAQPEFRPISLTLTIESEQELDILFKIFRANSRIPDMLIRDTDIDHLDKSTAVSLMEVIHSKLVQYAK